MSEALNRSTKNAWKSMIACAILSIFCLGFIGNTAALHWFPLMTELGVPRAVISMTSWVETAVKLIISTFYIVFLKKIGFRAMSAMGCMGAGLGLIFLYIAGKFVGNQSMAILMLCISFFFDAFLYAWGTTVAINTIVKNWVAGRQGFMFGFMPALGNLVGIIASPLVNQWILTSGWRETVLVRGIMAVGLSFVVFFLIKHTPDENDARLWEDIAKKEKEDAAKNYDAESEAKALEAARSGLTLKQAWKTPHMYLCILLFLFVGIATFPPVNYIAAHVAEIGYPVAAGFILSVVYIVALIASPVVGSLCEKYGCRLILSICLVFQLIGHIIYSMEGISLTLTYIAGACVGVNYTVLTIMLAVITKELFGLKGFEQIQSVFYAAMMLSMAVGGPIFNFLWDKTGHYYLSFKVIAVLTIVEMIILIITTTLKIDKSKLPADE